MIHGYAFTFDSYGAPSAVLRETKFAIDEGNLQPDQMVLKTLAAPVNPSDIFQIMGTYPSEPRMQVLDNTSGLATQVGGNEGVFEVAHVGAAVREYVSGNRVIPLLPSFGTWRSHALVDSSVKFVKVPDSLTLEEAATYSVNAASAYDIFHYVKNWNKGDWLVQNAGNSQVAQFLTQIGREKGVRTISVVRDGKPKSEIDQLYDNGATKVVSESDFLDDDFVDSMQEWKGSGSVRLAVNSVGGETVPQLVACLDQSGVILTLGAISGDGILNISSTDMIFRDIKAVGYWLSYNTKVDPQRKVDILKEVAKLYERGVIKDTGSRIERVDGLAAFLRVLEGSGKRIVKL